MRKIYIIIAFLIIILLGVILFLYFRKKEKLEIEIKNIVSFHLSYSKGYMMNADVIYDFYYDKETNMYMVSVKPYLIDEDEKVVISAPDGFHDKLKDILIKYNVAKWNGFKKYAKDVLDGDSFSFYVRMDDDKKIEANGYMMWPEGYRNVISEYDDLFMKIYNEVKEIAEND